MCGDRLKRLATVLLAVAFLAGGLPRTVIVAAAAPPESGRLVDAHPMHCAPSAPDPAIPAGSVPGCQHLNDCLACIAFDIPAGVRSPVPQRWVHFTYGSVTRQLTGVSPRPELTPPIRRS